jgi:hypothetical protein
MIRIAVDDSPVQAAILEGLELPGYWVGMIRFTRRVAITRDCWHRQ